MTALQALLDQLAAYVIDGEEAALDAACRALQAEAARIDIDGLIKGLAALKGQRADAQRLSLAERRVRGVLGLRMRPGPVCRPGP